MRELKLACRQAVLVAVAVLTPLLSGQQPCVAPADIEGSIATAPDAAAYTTKGDYLKQRGDLDCAVLSFENAIDLDSESWEPHFKLALTYLQKRQLGQALPHLRKTTVLRPEFLDARLALGSVLADTGEMEGAAREFTAAIQIDPRSAPARFHLAKIRFAQERYSAAIAHLEQALRITPTHAEYLLLLGLADSNNGDTDGAIRALSRLVESHPSHFLGRFNLATAYAHAERYPEAAEHFKEALRLDPTHDLSRLFASKALVRIENHQEALDLTDPWREEAPPELDEFEVRGIRGIALQGLGRFQEAEAVLRKAAELRPTDSEVQFHLGVVLARQKKLQQSREHLERAKELDPESKEVRFELLSLLRELGDTEAVRAESAAFEKRQRLGRSESMAEKAAALGSAYLKAGDAAAALREYRQAIEHSPGNAKLYYGMALALAADGAHTGGGAYTGGDGASTGARNAEGMRVDALETAVDLDPDYAEAHNELGIIHTQSGRFSEAEGALKAAIGANPQYAPARNNLGVLYGRQGRNLEAEAQLRRAVEDDPGYVEAFKNYGLTLAALGRFTEAEKALRKAAELEPGNPRVVEALRMLEALRN